MKNKINPAVIFIMSLVMFFLGGGAVYLYQTLQNPGVAKIESPPGVTEEIPSQPSQNPTSHKIAVFNGRGTKKTTTFTIPSQAKEWYINWTTGGGKGSFPGVFSITIHDVDGRAFPEMAANVMGKNQDMTVVRRSGNFYLEIIATQPYGIVIWAVY